MGPSRVPLDVRESGAVYFCYHHAEDTFSGILDDEYTLDEDDIRDFIQYDNPVLYHRLQGLPMNSYDTPIDLTAKRAANLGSLSPHSKVAGVDVRTQPVADQHSCEKIDSLLQSVDNAESHIDFKMLNLQLKRHVLMCLLNGHSLVLRRLPPRHEPLCCVNPMCRLDGFIFGNSFYFTLQQNVFPDGYTGLAETTNQTHYCLTCLEDIFDGDHIVPMSVPTELLNAIYDGVNHEAVLKAANRLYRPDSAEASTPPDQISPTSDDTITHALRDQDLQFRLQKQEEIQSTLREVKKYEKKRRLSLDSAITSSPSLLITRPPYMEAAKDRYKKQGLRQWDKTLALRQQRASEPPPSSQVSPISHASQGSARSVARYCYCWEPEDEKEEMIQCSNKLCLIEWFHLRCVDVQKNCLEDVDFLCDYCRDDYGPFTPEKENQEVVDDLTIRNDMVLEQADQLADDDSDDAGCDEEVDADDAEDENLTDQVPQWGTPINSQTMSHGSEGLVGQLDLIDEFLQIDFEDATTSAIDTLENVTGTQLDGWSKPKDYSSEQSTETASHNIVASSSYIDTSMTNLFPGSSQTTFPELAPFITAAGLSNAENKAFDEWKCNLPPSRVVHFLMYGGSYVAEGDEVGYAGQPPLSFLLANVSAHQCVNMAMVERRG